MGIGILGLRDSLKDRAKSENGNVLQQLVYYYFTIHGKLGLVRLGVVCQVAPGLTGGLRQVAPELTVGVCL